MVPVRTLHGSTWIHPHPAPLWPHHDRGHTLRRCPLCTLWTVQTESTPRVRRTPSAASSGAVPDPVATAEGLVPKAAAVSTAHYELCCALQIGNVHSCLDFPSRSLLPSFIVACAAAVSFCQTVRCRIRSMASFGVPAFVNSPLLFRTTNISWSLSGTVAGVRRRLRFCT